MTIRPYTTKSIQYYNLKYNFGITFPRWWSKYTVAACPKFDKEEVYISFVFRYGGKKYDPIFTIIVSPFGKKIWRKRYADSPVVFLGEFNRHSYSYVVAGELPNAFLKPDQLDYDYNRFGKQIRLLVRMVTSVAVILKSFKYI